MNNQKTATSSSVISNLANSKNRHHLHLVNSQKAEEIKGKSQEKPSNDLSVGDWVINASSRAGEIVKIVELKPGSRSVWVRYSGDNIEQRENPEDLTPLDPDDIPSENQQEISELIFNYLEQQSDFVPEIVIATELNIIVPVARQNLRQLGERVEDDGHGNWRGVQFSVAEVVVEECQHNWEFVPSPALSGFAERCSHCHEVRYIETSDRLEELIAWLNHQVEEFEQLSDKEVDERKQAYYQNCARNKQQLIKQVERHLAKAREEEKQELLQRDENGNQANPEEPQSLTVKEPKDLTWTWVESKLIRHHDRLECNDVKFLVTELKLCQFRLSEAKARNDSSALKQQQGRISYLKKLQKLAIVIDPQFLTLIPPLSPDEKQQLEANIIKHGCRDALVIWQNILLDGHNRLELCKKHNLDFQLHFMELEDRKKASDWIIMNQLGRRNLSSDWLSLLRGKIYCSSKLSHGGDRGNQHSKSELMPSRQSDDLPLNPEPILPSRQSDGLAKSNKSKTAKKVAQELGVSSRTIERDGKYAVAMANFCAEFGQHYQTSIISSSLTRKQVIELGNYVEKYPEEIESILDRIFKGDKPAPLIKAFLARSERPQFSQRQLVQIHFSNTDGLTSEQRLSNGQYALISEIYDHSYQVQLLGEKELMVKAEDIKPLKVASYTVNFSPSEFARLASQFNSPSELEAALKNRLFD